MQIFLPVGGFAVACVAFWTGVAEAQTCARLWATDAATSVGPRASFKPDDRFVLCLELQRGAYVSVWDAPPNGNPSRLYPNVITHRQNAASTSAVRLDAGRHCFGTPQTFPLYFPREQGTGNGRLSAVVTDAVADQPGANDWDIPGRTVSRSRMSDLTRRYGMGQTCEAKMTVYFDYRIAN